MESLFSHPQGNGRQANLGNTVLVNIGQLHKESDQWCLGYLQDIEGDQVLICLNSAKFPPRWISAKFVWYHRLVEFKMHCNYPLHPPPLNVQVALRNAKDGPYVFRPGKLLNRPSLENLYLCCVTVSTGETEDSNGQKDQVVHVHQWQVVESLLSNAPSLFGLLNTTAGSLDEIPVLKLVVHSEKVNAIETIDGSKMHRLVGRAVKHAGFARNYGTSDLLRMFIGMNGIGKDSITFLLFDLYRWRVVFGEQGLQGPREWTELSGRKFSTEIEQELEEINEPEARGAAIRNIYNKEETESTIGALAWELLSEVLLCLDFHSRIKVKRVCAVWHSLLSVTSPVVVIDFRSIGRRNAIEASEGYYLGTLIDQAVTQKTKTLVLFHHHARYSYWESGWTMRVIRDRLLLKGVKLSAIFLKNSYLIEYEMVRYYENADCMAHEMRTIPVLLPVCRRLLLLDIMVDSLVCECHTTYRWSKRPEGLHVTFPYLEFDGSATERETMKRYVEALESYLPPVDDVKAQFKERHQFFMETLPYPDGWQRFRQFLRRHNLTELSQSDSYWDALDLRNFDQLPLGKAILLLIDVCLNLAFETVIP